MLEGEEVSEEHHCLQTVEELAEDDIEQGEVVQQREEEAGQIDVETEEQHQHLEEDHDICHHSDRQALLSPWKKEEGEHQMASLISITQKEEGGKDPPHPSLPSSSRFPFLYLIIMLVGTCYLIVRQFLPPHVIDTDDLDGDALTTLSSLLISPSLESLMPWKVMEVIASAPPYGSISDATRRLYGLSLVLEASKPVTLSVVGGPPSADQNFTDIYKNGSRSIGSDDKQPQHKKLPRYDWDVRQEDGLLLLRAESVGPEVTVICTRPGLSVSITVIERMGGLGVAITFIEHMGEAASPTRFYSTDRAACKYVRREIRSLTHEDREAYLDSLNLFYRTSVEEGQIKYGPNFVNSDYLNAVHNSKKWCLHEANSFMAIHSAFSYWAEQNQRRINPSVIGPYWDWMIDHEVYGGQWEQSPVFLEDWLGPAYTSESNGYVLNRGRFANITITRDHPHNQKLYQRYHAGIDQFGFLNAGGYSAMNPSPLTTRCKTACGLDVAIGFSPPENLFKCYDQHNDWEEAIKCMYFQVHQQLHSHIGGLWNCAYDLNEIHLDYPVYSKELLSFLAITGRMIWMGNDEEGLGSYRECEGTTCTCNLAIEEMDDDDIYAMMEEPMHRALQIYPGREYISRINSHQKREEKENENKEREEKEEKREKEGKDKTGGKEKRREKDRLGFRNGIHHRPLSQADNRRLMRIIAKLWCQGAADGHFVSMHSLNDPIFYTSHITFDRMAHYITLSPELRRRGFNMTWTTPRVTKDKKHSCLGSSIEHSTPFLPSLMTPADPPFAPSPSSPSVSPSSATLPLSEKGTDRDKDKDNGTPFTPSPALPLLSEEGTDGHRGGDGGSSSPSDVGRSAARMSHEKASRRKQEKEEESEAAMAKVDMHNEEKEEKEKGDLERLEGRGKDTTNEEEEQKKEELKLSKEKEEVDTDSNVKEGEEEELEGFLSMRELDAMLHPLHPRLPYIYDDLTTWGNKVWKPKLAVEK